jgi:hypothetical protein
MIANKEYIKERNKLIPKAIAVADKKVGANRPKHNIDEWANKWNRCFLQEMSILWYVYKRAKKQK